MNIITQAEAARRLGLTGARISQLASGGKLRTKSIDLGGMVVTGIDPDDIPRLQREMAARAQADLEAREARIKRNMAMAQRYIESDLSMAKVGAEFGVSGQAVFYAVREYRRAAELI